MTGQNSMTPNDVFNYIDRQVAIGRDTSYIIDAYIRARALQCEKCYSAMQAYNIFSFDLKFQDSPRVMH